MARRLALHEVIEGGLGTAPDPDLGPVADGGAGAERADADVARTHQGEDGRILAREPANGDRGGSPRAHHGVVAAVHDGERKAGLGFGVDQDREDRRQVELGAVVLADRDPLAGGGLGHAGAGRLLDIGGHDLPLARILVEHNVALGLQVAAPLAVPAERGLDAIDVLAGLQQAHHVGAAEDQGLAVAPARHDLSVPSFGSEGDCSCRMRQIASGVAGISTASWPP